MDDLLSDDLLPVDFASLDLLAPDDFASPDPLGPDCASADGEDFAELLLPSPLLSVLLAVDELESAAEELLYKSEYQPPPLRIKPPPFEI